MPPPLYSTKDPDVKNSDVHVKNKFKWAWLDESVEYIDDHAENHPNRVAL